MVNKASFKEESILKLGLFYWESEKDINTPSKTHAENYVTQKTTVLRQNCRTHTVIHRTFSPSFPTVASRRAMKCQFCLVAVNREQVQQWTDENSLPCLLNKTQTICISNFLCTYIISIWHTKISENNFFWCQLMVPFFKLKSLFIYCTVCS